MSQYQQIDEFMRDVKRANSGFSQGRSSLRSLINVLKDNDGNASQVQEALKALGPDKVAKYRDAIWYLQATYPDLNPEVLGMGALEKTNAARYTQTNLPMDYDPGARPPDYNPDVNPPRRNPPRRNKPNSAWLNQTIEQWLLTTQGTKGILLIHLSGFQPPMDTIFSGRKVVDHINSVMRIGLLRGCDLLCLYMQGNPVCGELAPAANAYNQRKTDLQITPQHMGGRSEQYQNFARSHHNVVVMGFDADVCVSANLFGSPEKMPDGSFVPPLTSMTNVVTSRAVLVTVGVINNCEYGVLRHQ